MKIVDFYLLDNRGNSILLKTYSNADVVSDFMVNQYKEKHGIEEVFIEDAKRYEITKAGLYELEEFVSQYNGQKEIYEDIKHYRFLLNTGNRIWCRMG